MDVTLLKALGDNYIYVLRGADPSRVAVVDPGEAGPLLDHLERTGARPEMVLLTHHHHDHTDGVHALLHRFPGLPVVGGASDRGRIHDQTVFAADGDTLTACGLQARVLHVPGHTRGHVAYFFPSRDGGDLFSGDTLFAGTIGNLFEGTPDEMLASLRKIRALPTATRIWCAHEYTRAYLPEATRVEPHNERLQKRVAAVHRLAAGSPTVPLTLEEECATNPFLRWDVASLRERLGTSDDASTFRRLCEVA